MIALQKQRYRHDPPKTYGDCHRTCLAMMLGTDRDLVPHFYHLTSDEDEVPGMYDAWLRDCWGCAVGRYVYEGDGDPRDIVRTLGTMNGELPFLLLGTGHAGVGHSIVIAGGKTYDPSLVCPEGEFPLVGPYEDDYYYHVEFLVRVPLR